MIKEKEITLAIEKLKHETELQEIIQELNNIKEIVENTDDKEFITKTTKLFKKEITNYRKKFQKDYPLISNLIITPQEKPYLYICALVEELEKETELKNILKIIIELFTKVFKASKSTHITIEEQISILNLAQEKFNFLDILKTLNNRIDLYNLPFKSLDEPSLIMEQKCKKRKIIEFLQFNPKKIDIDSSITFTELIGRILNYVLVDSFDEGPYGLLRYTDSLGIEFDEKEKDGGPIIFSSIFTHALLHDTKYEIYLEENIKPLGSIFEEYVKNTINEHINLTDNETIEINSTDPCPCGSTKTYGQCCKKKKFKWLKKNNEIYKEVPLDEIVIENLKKADELIEEIIGRKLHGKEKAFKYLIGPDSEINRLIEIMKENNLPMEKIYATYKLDLPITSENIDLLPDYELKDWEAAIDEYRELTNKKTHNGINIIEILDKANKELKETWKKYISEAPMILNAFINETKDDYFTNRNFEINNISDFSVFCARRVSKNAEALYETLINNHYEVSMSIIRMLYEDLININVYINNKEMFEKHIIPLALIDKGIYKPYTDEQGNISNKTAINPKTNEKINYSITLKDLSKKASKNYNLLYEELFKDLSSFTHLNITSKNTYFKKEDPFFEIKNINIAGILGLFFINQIIYELSKLSTLNNFMYRDLLYFSDKVKFILSQELFFLKGITKNKFYDILLDCVKDYIVLK